jgi:hypothetical protein
LVVELQTCGCRARALKTVVVPARLTPAMMKFGKGALVKRLTLRGMILLWVAVAG